MRKVFLWSQVVILIVLAACNSGDQKDNLVLKEGAIYGVKSGIIHYKPMNMMGMTMTQTVYFDDYGNLEVREIVTEGAMMDQTMKVHSFDIREGLTNTHYEIENFRNGQDLSKKEAYRESLPKDFMSQQNLAKLSEEMKKQLSYKEDGTETVAGIKGTKYTMIPDSSNPTMIASGVHFKNIQLKFTMATIEMVADKVEIDVNVPAEKFKVPEGYKIIEQEVPADLNEDLPIEEGEQR